jgi:glycerophosphoryl diester phosphodiesterase
VAAAVEVGAQVVMPEKEMLSVALRDLTKAAGLKLATWVVDDPKELGDLERFELYGIATNRPGVMIEALTD